MEIHEKNSQYASQELRKDNYDQKIKELTIAAATHLNAQVSRDVANIGLASPALSVSSSASKLSEAGERLHDTKMAAAKASFNHSRPCYCVTLSTEFVVLFTYFLTRLRVVAAFQIPPRLCKPIYPCFQFYFSDEFSLRLDESHSELEEEEDEEVAGPSGAATLPDVPHPVQSVPTVTSCPIGTAAFYSAAAPRACPCNPPGPHAPPVPVRGRGRGVRAQTRGGRRGRGRARGRGQVRQAALSLLHQSYDDADQGNPPLQFEPVRPVGVHLGRLPRNTMMQAVEFFNLFFLLFNSSMIL
ncbi:PREDICTED: uncharacterized protein LOC107347991 [Acropora digitifera]|uniref:uncharacterized protein LOC107347991 n=1 Tax=Acropora digitifera TaxID=70779 RepID=UPI00077ABD6A|nr:PREDICTED: uncharacterized protein LOC107347991 [Acropora digitifera]